MAVRQARFTLSFHTRFFRAHVASAFPVDYAMYNTSVSADRCMQVYRYNRSERASYEGVYRTRGRLPEP